MSIASKGHNITGGIDTPKLRSYIERIERLEEDKAGIASDIKDVKAEAKGQGFDLKAMKKNERYSFEFLDAAARKRKLIFF